MGRNSRLPRAIPVARTGSVRTVTAIDDDHLRALLGKGDGGGAADTREASRDQNDWLVHCPTPDERLIDINSLMTGIAIDQLLHGGHRGLP